MIMIHFTGSITFIPKINKNQVDLDLNTKLYKISKYILKNSRTSQKVDSNKSYRNRFINYKMFEFIWSENIPLFAYDFRQSLQITVSMFKLFLTGGSGLLF